MFEYFGNKKELDELAKKVTALINEYYYDKINQQPVFPNKQLLRKTMNEIYSTPIPQTPDIFPQNIDDFIDKIFQNSVNLSHPKYLGHMDSGIVPEIVYIDAIISAINQNLLSWELSPVATYIENQVINWFKQLFNFPETAGGTFVSGGTIANLTGLLLSLYSKHKEAIYGGIYSLPKQNIYVSKEAHYSIIKSAAILGLGTKAVIPIETNKEHKININDLEKKIARTEGETLAIIGIAGATNSGAIDSLNELADISEENNAWFHVDAAYGGALILTKQYKNKLQGIEKADSIAFDPHKLLWMPKSTAIFLTKNHQSLKILDHHASYIPVHPDQYDNTEELDQRSLGKRTIQGSRRFDALRVWYLFHRFGVKTIEKAITSRIELTQKFYDQLKNQVDTYLVPFCRPEMNIICFSINPLKTKELSNTHKENILRKIHQKIEESGKGWISLTKINEETVLRMVILNFNTTLKDLNEIFNEMETIAKKIIHQKP